MKQLPSIIAQHPTSVALVFSAYGHPGLPPTVANVQRLAAAHGETFVDALAEAITGEYDVLVGADGSKKLQRKAAAKSKSSSKRPAKTAVPLTPAQSSLSGGYNALLKPQSVTIAQSTLQAPPPAMTIKAPDGEKKPFSDRLSEELSRWLGVARQAAGVVRVIKTGEDLPAPAQTRSEEEASTAIAEKKRQKMWLLIGLGIVSTLVAALYLTRKSR